MTDKEKLKYIKKLADAMYYAAQYLTTDASRLHKAMEEYRKFIIYECKEEPVSETNKVVQVRRCLEEVATTINPFVDEVIEQFNLKDKSIVAKEIQYRGVGLKGDFGENIRRSDDEVIYILKEDKIVGLIVIRRTEFNNAEITMVKTEERFKEKSND